MPRRHPQRESVPPLDLTPADLPRPPRPKPLRPGERGETWAERQITREREGAERQKQARIRGGIDWSICLVPGCGEELKMYGMLEFHHKEHRDPEKTLPLCTTHAVTVWQNVQALKGHPVIIETNEMLIQRAREREQAAHEAAKRRRLESKDGHIYFLRLNGLIKAGWTRDLHDRLRAYGPDVEILCHYKGSRDDETNLHRNLRPFLARGREWYEDCKAMQDIIAKAVEIHGPPYISAAWTIPTELPVRARKSSRSRPTGLSR